MDEDKMKKVLKCLEKPYTLKVNALEAGILLTLIHKFENEAQKDYLGAVANQLILIYKEIQEAAGVTVTKLPNGLLKLVDAGGNTITRLPLPWEV